MLVELEAVAVDGTAVVVKLGEAAMMAVVGVIVVTFCHSRCRIDKSNEVHKLYQYHFS